MASSVAGFGTVAPAPAGPKRVLGWRATRPSPSFARVPATKVVAAKAKAEAEEKGLFETIFGALYKEEQLLETDPILNKVEGKAPAAAAPKKAAGKAAAAAAEESGNGGGFLGGLFKKG